MSFLSFVHILIVISLHCLDVVLSRAPDAAKLVEFAHSPKEDLVGVTLGAVFGPEYIQKVESALKEAYGDREVTFFRHMIADFEKRYVEHGETHMDDPGIHAHITDNLGDEFASQYRTSADTVDREHRISRALVQLIKEQFNALNEVHDIYVKPNLDRFNQVKTLSQQVNVKTDTPCSTQASCDGLEILINLCSYIRNGSHMAYEIFVIMIHVLSTMMAVLCGCLFVGPTRICFLQNFPYTCRIPYPVFNGAFQSTISVWQLVKVVTNVCRIYGDPGFGSTFA
ncbi:putative integral membrane protein [Babesia bovis T2Bo]|uniref:putative integral membrane protein n=1 Tax=Babesia bovis T2Bo TaxID=484906 RepID=UPI001DEF0560|nr:putative integral membrane protein [Babesia bovis T2Bo]EDO06967.2 putative integral membrane protein [Babesia bovis T2Bo]